MSETNVGISWDSHGIIIYSTGNRNMFNESRTNGPLGPSYPDNMETSAHGPLSNCQSRTVILDENYVRKNIRRSGEDKFGRWRKCFILILVLGQF